MQRRGRGGLRSAVYTKPQVGFLSLDYTEKYVSTVCIVLSTRIVFLTPNECAYNRGDTFPNNRGGSVHRCSAARK